MEGRMQEAIELQLKTKKLFNLLFSEVNPIPIKAALAMMGMIENELRLPLTPMDEGKEAELRQEMENLGILS